MTASEWATVADLATALGTLVLAVATFASVRSANLMARVARQQLLVELRPVLTTSRREDPPLKVNFGDMKWVRIPGGGAVAEAGSGDGAAGAGTTVVYLAIGLRNAGNGIAVLQGWRFFAGARRETEHAPLTEFRRQNRDLYIPVDDVGFWQGAFRDPDADGYRAAREAVETHEPWTVELLYADHEGGQRAVSRFLVLPVQHHDEEGADPVPAWLASNSKHWSVDLTNRSWRTAGGRAAAQQAEREQPALVLADRR
jgi:hypothetical protein